MRVRDIDFLRRRMTLIENAPIVGTAVVIGSLKGHTNRTVPIPKSAADELAVRKGRDDLLWSKSECEHLGPPASKDSWMSGAVARRMKTDETFPRVTPTPCGTPPPTGRVGRANVKAVQKMLGHKSAAMSLDVYADLFDDDLNAVAERLEQSASRVSPNALDPKASSAQEWL
ncbi:hypothetical protein ACWFRF_13160 [Nocardia sp. NPDC055165]